MSIFWPPPPDLIPEDLDPDIARRILELMDEIDPDEDRPVALLGALTAVAMERAGIHEALVMAYLKSGILLGEGKEDIADPDGVREWDQVLRRWERKHKQTLPYRRISLAHLEGIMRECPTTWGRAG